MEHKKGDKIKKKEGLFGLNKKQIASIGITSIVAFGIIFGGTIFVLQLTEEEGDHLICAIAYYGESIDPLIQSMSPDTIIYDQVIEGLYISDQFTKNCPTIYNLAVNDSWSPDYLNFTCSLRKGVKFHDGTEFNATAVKWNFDRIHRLLDNLSWPYAFINNEGDTIINKTQIIDEYTVRFVLNKPFVPIRELLSAWNTYILSPTSTPENDFLDSETDKLIGTGPFIMGSITLTEEKYIDKVTFTANPDYWGGEPQISKVTLIQLSREERSEGLASGELSYSYGSHDPELIEWYRNLPGYTLITKTSKALKFMTMNNDVFPVEMRKAFSYALNYSYFFNVFTAGLAVRVKSPLSKGLLYSNWEDFNLPDYDITIARQTLIDASWPNTTGLTANNNVSAGNEWEQLVTDGNSLAIYNFSISVEDGIPNGAHMFIYNTISNDFKHIGVKIEPLYMSRWDWYIKLMTGGMEFFYSGWAPAFNDPIDNINPVYSNKSDGIFNHLNFSDPQIQQWIDDGIEEFNETKREVIYFNIQKRLIEELYPVIWLDCPYDYDIWASNIKGIPHELPYFKFILKHVYIEK